MVGTLNFEIPVLNLYLHFAYFIYQHPSSIYRPVAKEYYDIVILGIGGMGSATLYNLAKRGLKVCGIERFGIAHDRGSSHGESRMIRKAYFEHPDYIPLLDRSYQLWQDLQEESGEKLFENNGLLLAGSPNSSTIQGLEACYTKHDLPHERMRNREAMKRFPQFNLHDDMEVFYDPLAGFLYVEKCVEKFVQIALNHGATLYTNEKVKSWQVENNSVSVTTERRQVYAERLIITSGAWTKRDLATLGVELEIWRKVLFWYDSPNLDMYKPDTFPNFYVELDYGGFYGFPALNPLGLKVGEHTLPNVVNDLDNLNRNLEPDDEPIILQFLNGTFPQLEPQRTRFTVCMYSKSPDDNFILDRHPKYQNVIIGAGFSGHGFKFAPVVGEILGDLALNGITSHPIDFLRLRRLIKSNKD